MFHGLMKDSAVIGTYKHIKHATKPKRGTIAKAQSLSEDLKDLIDGFKEIAEIIRKMKGNK